MVRVFSMKYISGHTRAFLLLKLDINEHIFMNIVMYCICRLLIINRE